MDWRDRVRAIDPSTDTDEKALSEFTCARIGEPWAVPVQDAIRQHVVEVVRSGRSTGLVCIDGSDIVGVATLFDPADDDPMRIGYGSILATAVTHRRRGIARALKVTLIEEGRTRGHRFVRSLVHEDNTAMLALNQSLGASMEPTPADGPEPHHISCVIAL